MSPENIATLTEKFFTAVDCYDAKKATQIINALKKTAIDFDSLRDTNEENKKTKGFSPLTYTAERWFDAAYEIPPQLINRIPEATKLKKIFCALLDAGANPYQPDDNNNAAVMIVGDPKEGLVQQIKKSKTSYARAGLYDLCVKSARKNPETLKEAKAFENKTVAKTLKERGQKSPIFPAL